ncbi:MAG: proton-conducting transporter membrane subunit [Anaerolineae bacterium]|jgi:formate hydrogenlyase subunit 3/multisubunit Na+/H+ antiporter MnhD subunit|nr:hypothetical protein [Chloroflexota bacterium]
MTLTILIVPFVAAGIVYALRTLRLACATVASLAALLIAALLLIGGDAPALVLLGRSLYLAAPVRAHIAFTLVLLSAVLLTSWQLPEDPLASTLAFMALGFLLWALALGTLSLGVLLLVASILMMLMAVTAAPGPASLWPVRVLAIVIGAAFLMLSAAWMLEHSAGTSQNPGQLAPILLFLGSWVLMGAFPFSVWYVPALRSDSSVGRVLLGALLSHALLVHILLQLETVLAPINALVPVLMFYAGIATLILGGIGAAVQRRVSGVLAYLSMGSLGSALIALGAGSSVSEALGLTTLLYRGVGLTAMSIGVRTLTQSVGDDSLETMRGAFHRAPMAVLATLLGGFSLAGFPPLAGFTTNFTLFRMIASQSAQWAVALAATTILPALALTRLASRVFLVVPVPSSRREPRTAAIVGLVLGALLLLLGLWPDALSSLSGPWTDILLSLTVAS